jgi:hypothetical protein
MKKQQARSAVLFFKKNICGVYKHFLHYGYYTHYSNDY